MIYLVFENVSNIICPFTEAVKKQFMESSIACVDVRNLDTKRYEKPPLFNTRWLLLCPPEITEQQIASLLKVNKDNIILIKVVTRAQLGDVQIKLKDFEFVYVDNYKLKREETVLWIVKNLNCTDRVANMIFDKVGTNVKAVVNAVHVLSALNEVQVSDVVKYVKPIKKIGPSDVVRYILHDSDVSYKDIVGVVWDYRYAISWLKDLVVKELKTVEEVFNAIELEGLNVRNFRQFQTLTESKTIMRMSDYQLRKKIELHESVSLEYVYAMLQLFEGVSTGRMAFASFIRVLRIV